MCSHALILRGLLRVKGARTTLDTHLALTASWNASSSQSRSLCVNSLTSCYERGTNRTRVRPSVVSRETTISSRPDDEEILLL